MTLLSPQNAAKSYHPGEDNSVDAAMNEKKSNDNLIMYKACGTFYIMIASSYRRQLRKRA